MSSDQTSRQQKPPVEPRSGLTHGAIRQQVEKIVGHNEFLATDKMRDFLQFVVEETLAGRRHRIKGFTIATHVFDRSDDFDSAHDPIVSIQAGRLRRALERYYLVAGSADPVYIEIPKGAYVPRFSTQASPAVLQAGRPRPVTGRSRAAPSGPSLAVLPFQNLSDDPGQLFFSVGLTEELTTELNRFQDLWIIPCQPVDSVNGLPRSPAELGRTLGARFILQGSVRRDSMSIKVAGHLIDTRTGSQIWSEDYSRPLEASPLIATQEEIARKVVAVIGGEYGIIARRLSTESRKKSPQELDTYEAMLRYYTHQIKPSPESSESCFRALERAAEKEPEFGPVWSALATLHCQMYSMDVDGFEKPLATGIRYARRGVELEPASQLGRLILAYAYYLDDASEDFEAEIEAALKLNPNSPYTMGTAGYFHVMRGRYDQGLSLLDRAIAISPCYPSWFQAGYFFDHVRHHDFEKALQVLDRHAPFMSFWLWVAYAYVSSRLGRADEAARYLDRVSREKPDFSSRARELMRRTVKEDSIVDEVIDGLREADLTVESR